MKNRIFSRFSSFFSVKPSTRGFLNTYNLMSLKSRDSEKLVALESKRNHEKWVFFKILAVFSVKPFTPGFSITRDLMRSNSKNSENLVELESRKLEKNRFFFRF